MLARILWHLGIIHQCSSCMKERCVQPPEIWGIKCVRAWEAAFEGPGREEVDEEKNTWVVLGAALQRSCVKTPGTAGGTQTCINIWKDVFPSFSASVLLGAGLKWDTLVELAKFQRVGMLVYETNIYHMKNFNSNQILHLKAFQLQNYILTSAGEFTALAAFLLKVWSSRWKFKFFYTPLK